MIQWFESSFPWSLGQTITITAGGGGVARKFQRSQSLTFDSLREPHVI